MKKNNTFLFPIFVLLLSCAETVEQNNSSSELRVIKNNDIVVENEDFIDNEELNTFEMMIQDYFQPESLPFALDSNYTSKIYLAAYDEKNVQNELFYDEIKELSSVYIDNEEVGYGKWYIKSFLEIDSLKLKEEYDSFVEKGDIGMVLYSRAYGVSVIELDENTNVYIWAISYSTYEACPFSSGQYFFASTFYQSKLTETILVGENTAGGDPPSMGSTYTQAIFKKDNKITLKKTDIFEDLDDETYNTTENKTIEIRIENGKFKTISIK